MEIVINNTAKIELEKLDTFKYIHIYLGGYGWMAGLQMEFVDELNENSEVFNIDGYSVSVTNHLMRMENYLEIKYSNNFITKGFYVSKLRKLF